MKVTGMLGKLELNPLRRPIWAWIRFYLTPKGDHAKTDNQKKGPVILNALKIDAKIDGVWFFHIDISLRTKLSDTCMGKNVGFPSWKP